MTHDQILDRMNMNLARTGQSPYAPGTIRVHVQTMVKDGDMESRLHNTIPNMKEYRIVERHEEEASGQ